MDKERRICYVRSPSMLRRLSREEEEGQRRIDAICDWDPGYELDVDEMLRAGDDIEPMDFD